jgi:hypothetical protein
MLLLLRTRWFANAFLEGFLQSLLKGWEVPKSSETMQPVLRLQKSQRHPSVSLRRVVPAPHVGDAAPHLVI